MAPSKPSHGHFLTSVPFLMAGGLVLGTLTAVAHHVFASQVNGHAVESNEQQQWYIAIVTGLAFLTRAFLSASAGLAYTQLLWYILRSISFSLVAVDATFSIVNNPCNFLSWELWSNGFSLVFMATIIWAIPIIAIFTPGTLTVESSAEPKNTVVQRPIPNLNYSAVRQFGQIAAGTDTRLQFYGPSISCGSAITVNATRIADTVHGPYPSYPTPFVSFVPEVCDRFPNETDPAICGLWLTQEEHVASPTFDSVSQDVARLYVVVPDQEPTALQVSANKTIANKTIECVLFNTSYGVEYSYGNGQPNLAVRNATRLNGVGSGTALGMCGEAGGHEASVCFPEAIAYLSLLNALGQQLIGYLVTPHQRHTTAIETQVAKTAFMDTKELYQPQYFMNHGVSPDTVPADAMGMAQALEEVFTNATLSLFSSSSFLQNETGAIPIPVIVLTPQNKFVYRRRNLLISYISGVTATTVCVLVGFLCITKTSSTAFSASFSTIMRTTRNPELDALVSPAETSGAEPLGKELAVIRLKLVRQGSAFSRFQPGMDASADHWGGEHAWTCFAVQEDVPSTKRDGKVDLSDVDIDSLLAPSEE